MSKAQPTQGWAEWQAEYVFFSGNNHNTSSASRHRLAIHEYVQATLPSSLLNIA
jgi:hypothetical protein